MALGTCSDVPRRQLLRGAGAAVSIAWLGLGTARAQAALAMEVPAVADNGAVVPVTVSASLPDVREIRIVVEGNPQPLAAEFVLPEGTAAFVATRIKMAASGSVEARVRTADGRWHVASRHVEVMRGGCG